MQIRFDLNTEQDIHAAMATLGRLLPVKTAQKPQAQPEPTPEPEEKPEPKPKRKPAAKKKPEPEPEPEEKAEEPQLKPEPTPEPEKKDESETKAAPAQEEVREALMAVCNAKSPDAAFKVLNTFNEARSIGDVDKAQWPQLLDALKTAAEA